ncbi:type VI secretion system tip protein VgrG, partial [Photobacterium damselae subsp. damselae]|nr:type VI secretion system tip protein VgrG [Photobacterium damselae subsp. damselae]
VGSKINLNSGGSAGSGSGYAGSAPLLPGGVEPAKTITEVQSSNIAPTKEAQNALLKESDNQDDFLSKFRFSS